MIEACIDIGKGDVVIFLNGLSVGESMWRPIINVLKEKYRVVVPGFPRGSTDIRQLSQLLHEYIESHDLLDVHLVGHSIGAQVALMYVHDHPDKVNRLVLTSSSGVFESAILNSLAHRVMLLWGLKDDITPPEVALHLQDFLRNSEVRFIEQCGHMPMVEEPEIFSRHLLSFLN